MQSICVFCGSNQGNHPLYYQEARKLGRELALQNITLIYGGAAVGIMGAIANSALSNEGQVIGVIPDFLSKKEIRHEGLTQLITVASMHQRKEKMAELAEGFIALPGGLGTLEELCEILTWSQLGLVPHPVGILNTMGYFDGLLNLFDHMVAHGFLKAANRNMILASPHIHDLLDQMHKYKPLNIPKWLDQTKT